MPAMPILGPVLFSLSSLMFSAMVTASGLPEPSRTLYKCQQHGKVVYSDSPCLGAQRITVEPTRGMNKMTGQEKTGNDVYQERHREMMADALKPLTGMDAKEFDKASKRMKLEPKARAECSALDRQIASDEVAEKRAAPHQLGGIQQQLFDLRTRYRDLRC